jgi:hypothetical protein
VSERLAVETVRRVEEFLAAYRAEVLRLLAMGGKRRRELRAVAIIEGCQLAADSHVEGPRSYPFDSQD